MILRKATVESRGSSWISRPHLRASSFSLPRVEAREGDELGKVMAAVSRVPSGLRRMPSGQGMVYPALAK